MAIVFIRTLIIYFALLLILRLLGKRQLGEMELSEFVVASLIADLAAHPLQDIGIPMLNGLVPILTLFCCELIIAGLCLKSIRLRNLLFGSPSILIRSGRIDQKAMRQNRFTLDELMQELRSQGITDIRKIAYAILETNGRLSVIPFPASAPVTPDALGLREEEACLPIILISDGRLLSENLHQAGLTEEWLKERLYAQDISSVSEVFLMTVCKQDVNICIKEEGTCGNGSRGWF